MTELSNFIFIVDNADEEFGPDVAVPSPKKKGKKRKAKEDKGEKKEKKAKKKKKGKEDETGNESMLSVGSEVIINLDFNNSIICRVWSTFILEFTFIDQC